MNLPVAPKSPAVHLRERVTQTALRLLALGRVSSSDLCARLPGPIDRLRRIPTDRLHRFLAVSGLHAWLECVEARVTGRENWFSRGFQLWSQLEGDRLDDFLVAYLETRVRIVDSGDANLGLAASFSPNAPAGFEIATTELETVGRIVLDCWDPFLCADFAGMETMARERDRRAHALLAGGLREALERISDWSPEFRQDLDALIVEVVPCRSPDGRSMPSGSCSLIPGAVFLSCVDDADAVAELVVHEASHIGLSLIDRDEALVEAISKSQAWDDERWYSPWRDQPRSLMGVLHAIHVFARVLDYHRYRYLMRPESAAFSSARLVTLHAQLRLALSENDFAPLLSPAGRRILDDAQDLVVRSAIPARRALAAGAQVLLAERHRLWSAPGLPAEATVASHRAWYADKYSERLS